VFPVGPDEVTLAVPKTYRFVIRGAHDPARPGTVNHAGDPVAVAFQQTKQTPRGRVPDADHPVVAGAGQLLPVGAEGATRHAPGVPLQAVHLPSRGHIPQAYGPVIAG